MKTILTYLCLLLCLSPSIAANDDLNCEGCTEPPTLVFDNNCQIRVSTNCTQVEEWWLIAPGGGVPDVFETTATTFTFNIDGPGVYRIIYASECDGAPKKSFDLEVSVDCSECAPPEGQLDFIWANASNSEPTDCALTFTPVFTGTGVIEEYQWTFSNGIPSISDENTPTVSFPQNATSAEVCLTISLEAAGGECPNTTICKTVPLSCGPCDGFTARLDYELDGCTIKLDGSSSTSGNANIVFHAYAINGTYLYYGGYTPTIRTHQFSANGAYEICVRIFDLGFDDNGQWTVLCMDEVCETVIVTGCSEPCIREDLDVYFAPGTNDPFIDDCLEVEVNVGLDYPSFGECNEITYYLDFGDDYVCNLTAGECNSIGSGSVVFEHTYEEEGTYTICLYGFDNCGCYYQDCFDYTVDCLTSDECLAYISPSFCDDTNCDVGEPGGCNQCFTSAFSIPSAGAVIVNREWTVTYINFLNEDFETLTYSSTSEDEIFTCFPFEAYWVRVCLKTTDSNGCMDEDCYLTSNGCIPFQEEDDPVFANSNPNSSIPNFNIFPNPSQGSISVQYSDPIEALKSIQIYDLNGRLVWQQSNTSQYSVQKLDLDLPSGTYILKAITTSSTYAEKIVIAR